MTQEKCGQHEEGIEIPLERISPDILQKMIEEFVTREWTEWGDSGCSHDEKVAQVLQQMKAHTAKVVYDATTESWNIVASRR
jgi:uncharacterized protein YheU (UPF0270 family)